MIDETTKEQIAIELAKYVNNIGGQVKAGNALGVSNAYVSQIVSGKYEAVSDNMWRKISKQLGTQLDEVWNYIETKPTKKITGYFDDARMHGNVFGLVCTPGSGKTATLNHFDKKHKNVFYVKCERHMSEKDVLRLLLKSMGRTVATRDNITSLLEQISNEALTRSCPVIIIDEIEKTKNDVFYLFIDLYNMLWKRCGIVLIGTPNLKTRIVDGYRRGLLGFNEILSRLGGKLIEIPSPDKEDAALVVRGQGIDHVSAVAFIVNDSEVKIDPKDKGYIDMRRVERLVHAQKQKGEQAA